VFSGTYLRYVSVDQTGTRKIEERTIRMNVALRRATLMVCVLAGALALAVALVVARDASAAPPEPFTDSFTVDDVCDFPVLLEATGKTKGIELPGGRFISVNPGFRVTVTNEEEPTHQITYVVTGAAHVTELDSGELLVVFTGRNLLFDPSYGMLLTMGRFTQVIDLESGAATPPEGKGRVIDVCERLG